MRKTVRTMIIIPAVLVMTVIFMQMPSFAGTKAVRGAKVYELEINKTYTKYDITGDKKADKIRIRAITHCAEKKYIRKFTIYINGKRSFSKSYAPADAINYSYATNCVYPQIKLIRLKNGKPFLYIHTSTYNGYYSSGNVYIYKSGKLKSIINTKALLEDASETFVNCRLGEMLKRVSGNSIYFSVGELFNMGNSLSYRYTYSQGTLKKRWK